MKQSAKIRRRGFLGGLSSLLSFTAFEKSCLVESGLLTPIDLKPEVQYYGAGYEEEWAGVIAICHDHDFLEKMCHFWNFDYLASSIMARYDVRSKKWIIDPRWADCYLPPASGHELRVYSDRLVETVQQICPTHFVTAKSSLEELEATFGYVPWDSQKKIYRSTTTDP